MINTGSFYSKCGGEKCDLCCCRLNRGGPLNTGVTVILSLAKNGRCESSSVAKSLKRHGLLLANYLSI